MAYNFTVSWLKGALNHAADTLSRHPCSKPSQGDDLAEYDLNNGEAPSISQMRASTVGPWESENLHLQELRRHAAEDPEYQDLKGVITSGFPDAKNALPDPMLVYQGSTEH